DVGVGADLCRGPVPGALGGNDPGNRGPKRPQLALGERAARGGPERLGGDGRDDGRGQTGLAGCGEELTTGESDRAHGKVLQGRTADVSPQAGQAKLRLESASVGIDQAALEGRMGGTFPGLLGIEVDL